MDTTNHTVTIPLSDYNAMKGALNSQTAMFQHFKLMMHELKIKTHPNTDFFKTPKNVRVTSTMGNVDTNVIIEFEY